MNVLNTITKSYVFNENIDDFEEVYIANEYVGKIRKSLYAGYLNRFPYEPTQVSQCLKKYVATYFNKCLNTKREIDEMNAICMQFYKAPLWEVFVTYIENLTRYI